MRFLLAAFVVSLLTVWSHGQVIPANRLPDPAIWPLAGVPGGIPLRTKIVDLTGMVLTDGTDQAPNINAAIAAATAGDVLLLPAGIITISSRINGNKDNITLRGRFGAPAGWQTTLNFTASDILVRGNENLSGPYPISGSPAKGTTTLTIPGGTSAFVPGRIIRIWQDNSTNPNEPIIDVSGQAKLQSQMTVVTAKDASTITISPGLIFDLSASLNPEIYQTLGTRVGFGIEDLKIDDTNKPSGGSIQFWAARGSWMKNCWVYNVAGYSVYSFMCVQNEFNHNLIEINRNPGPNRSGIKVDTSSSLLIVDNILLELFPGVEINGFPGYGGSSGNVIAYNFARGAPTGAADLVGYSFDSNHGAHTQADLYEGNIGQKFISDGYYGSSSKMTVFRNWFYGVDPNPIRVGDIQCINLARMTRNYNIVGNLLGLVGHTWTVTTTSGGSLYGNKYIYKFNYPGSSNFSGVGTAQPSVGDWWDNFDMQGTLTTRLSDTTGEITMTNGRLANNQLMRLTWSGGSRTNQSSGIVVGLVVPFSGGSGTILPTVGTTMQITTDTNGWKEMDLDVQATTLVKGNYNTQDAAIPASESLGADILPDSYYLSAKPAFFGSLNWPAFDPNSPNMALDAIPAGYRFMHADHLTAGPLQPPRNTDVSITEN